MIAGKDKGKSGLIYRVFPKRDLVIVSGLNMLKKRGEKGKIIDKAMPIHASNVMIIDSESKKPTRVGRKLVGGRLIRISRKSGREV